MSIEMDWATEMNRNASIDRARGIAIAMVVIYHYAVFCPTAFPPLTNKIVRFFVNHGYSGVSIFFVISGFLITSTSLRRWNSIEAIEPLSFYGLRAARIVPGLLLLITVLWMLYAADVAPFAAPLGDMVSATWHALMFQFYRLHNPTLIAWSPIWSLSVEETFYLLYPIACVVLRNMQNMIAALGCFVLLGPLFRGFALFGQFAHSVDALAIGCLAALSTERSPIAPGKARTAKIAGAAIGVFGVFLIGKIPALPETVLCVGVALFLMGATVAPTEERGGADRILRQAGQHCYEIYLFHLPLILIFAKLPSTEPALQAIQLAICMIVTMMIAAAVNNQLTEPLNRFFRQRQGSALVV